MNKDEFTNDELFISVGDGHKLYVVDWGKKDSEKVIVHLHGGPGSRTKDKHKLLFNPRTQRVIFFDQRGCGKSTPAGSLKNNTTEDLAKDITKITDHLKIPKFYLHGYSWGSTLTLYYAINYPKKLAGIIIGGIFSGHKNEMANMYELAKIFYPDIQDKILNETPEEYHDDPIAYHLNKSLNGAKEEQKKSTYILGNMEYALSKLDDRIVPEAYNDYEPECMQIELAYVANGSFMPENYLIEKAYKINVPVYIVQGRFDMVCTPGFAYKISKLIPNCKLYMATSNHSPEHEITNLFRSIFDSID